MATSDYLSRLNAWHLQLAMLRDLVNHLLLEVDGPEWLTSSGCLASEFFSHLVETCPFPSTDADLLPVPGKRKERGGGGDDDNERRSAPGVLETL